MLDRALDSAQEPSGLQRPERGRAFLHEALLYAGADEFVAGTLPFIRDGIEADEPTLVFVDASKIELLSDALGADANRVEFADMAVVGHNPARIIPAWRDFVDLHPGRPIRGIGEPIGPQRSGAELVECHRHEALLNLAFAGHRGFLLMCPYDLDTLEPEVIAEACRSHAFLERNGVRRECASYAGLVPVMSPFADPLPEPAVPPSELDFQIEALTVLRRFVLFHADRVDMPMGRTQDLVLAVNEVAANAARHAGGRGLLRIWQEGNQLVCEIRDDGQIDDPLAGRERPTPGQMSGYGLWLANQLCDLVQIRSFATGSVVRLHMRRDP